MMHNKLAKKRYINNCNISDLVGQWVAFDKRSVIGMPASVKIEL